MRAAKALAKPDTQAHHSDVVSAEMPCVVSYFCFAVIKLANYAASYKLRIIELIY